MQFIVYLAYVAVMGYVSTMADQMPLIFRVVLQTCVLVAAALGVVLSLIRRKPLLAYGPLFVVLMIVLRIIAEPAQYADGYKRLFELALGTAF